MVKISASKLHQNIWTVTIRKLSTTVHGQISNEQTDIHTYLISTSKDETLLTLSE